MIEIYPNLYIGTETDYESSVKVQENWAIVQACKDPYHRDALGYTGRGAPKDHPEYLVARRDNRLILNLVDGTNPRFVPKEIVDSALAFIHENLGTGRKVLVHCNHGLSRSPAIGLLYLRRHTEALSGPFDEAEAAFRVLYPSYNPMPGIREFARENWSVYGPK
jgi:predicted protein tyrosine phosphatase